MLYDILEGDWIEQDEGEIDDRAAAALASDALLVALGVKPRGYWPCGHMNAADNTHRIGAQEMCRRCRRVRWTRGFNRAVIKHHIYRKEDINKWRVRNKDITNKVRTIKREAANLNEVIEHLAGVRHPENGRLPMDVLFAEVEAAFQLPEGTLTGGQRAKEWINARAVVIRIFKDRGYSLKKIARLIDRSDHTTISHSLASFVDYAERDPRVLPVYAALRDRA